MPITIIALSVIFVLALINTWKVAASVGRKAGYKVGFINGNKWAEHHYHTDATGEWLSPEHEALYREKTTPDAHVPLCKIIESGEGNWR